MNQANGEKVLEGKEGNLPTSYPLIVQQSRKMPALRHQLYTILVLSLLTVALASANRVPRSPTVHDQKKFQDILNSVEPSSLHEILHEHVGIYKDGVYQNDKTAVAAVHELNTEVGGGLLALAKRQVRLMFLGASFHIPDDLRVVYS